MVLESAEAVGTVVYSANIPKVILQKKKIVYQW